MSCVTAEMSLDLSETQYPHLRKEVNKGLVEGLHKKKMEKHFINYKSLYTMYKSL